MTKENKVTNIKNQNIMEKYSALKSLARIINFIAWLNLIAGIIVALYSNGEELGIIYIISSVVSGAVGFVLLLGFGKLIQIALEIRENQIMIGDAVATENNDESFVDSKKIELSEATLLDLRRKIHRHQSNILGGNSDEILDFLSKLITTKQRGLDIIIAYEKQFGGDLIDELRDLSSNYKIIKKYLEPFIEFEIVEKEFPHKMI